MTAPTSLQLGQTQDPKALIPGEVSVVHDNADHVEDERTRMTTARDDFNAVSMQDALDGGLTSLAFAIDSSQQSTKFTGLIEVLTTTHGALTTYATALGKAQGLAQTALDTWNKGEQATTDAKVAHTAAVDAYNASLCAPAPTPTSLTGQPYTIPTITQGPPAPFSDPGEAMREEAQAILDGARQDLEKAGATALHTLGAPDEKDDGKQNSSDGDVDWIGGDGDLEGPSISWSFWERTFGDEEAGDDDPFKISLGKASGEVYVFNAEGEFENYYGDVRVNGDGSVTVLGADGSAEATIDKEGVKINADGTITILGAEGSIHGELGPAEIGLEGKALIGGTASGELTIGTKGIHADGELFAGGKIEGAINGDVGGVGGEVRGEGWAGFGIAGNAELGYDDGKIKVGGDGGVAFILGGKVGGEVTLDLPEIYNSGKDVIGWLVP